MEDHITHYEKRHECVYDPMEGSEGEVHQAKNQVSGGRWQMGISR